MSCMHLMGAHRQINNGRKEGRNESLGIEIGYEESVL